MSSVIFTNYGINDGEEEAPIRGRAFFRPLYKKPEIHDIDEFANELSATLGSDLGYDILDGRETSEAIIICFDKSGSMQLPCFSDLPSDLSRLDIIKECWYAFINRLKAYDFANHIGLIVFDSNIVVECSLTPLYEKFRNCVEKIEIGTATKLRDAMKLGTDLLLKWKNDKNKKADRINSKLRLITLTDGRDNDSIIKPVHLTQILQRNNIVADAICIGNHNVSLHSICRASRGYVFFPKTFVDCIRIFELETFLSQNAREIVMEYTDDDEKSNNYKIEPIYSEHQLNTLGKTKCDICTFEKVPKHKQLKEIKVATNSISVEKYVNINTEFKDKENENEINSNNAKKRLLKELKIQFKDPHEGWDIYPCSNDILFWKLIVKGPESSHYEDGTWLLYLKFSKHYPAKPPEMRFVTPIRHVNVNSYGRICHAIFDRNYSSDTTIRDILDNIYGLLMYPDFDAPLDNVLRTEYADDPVKFFQSIKEHTAKYAASKSRNDWKKILSN
eukprot:362348_1